MSIGSRVCSIFAQELQCVRILAAASCVASSGVETPALNSAQSILQDSRPVGVRSVDKRKYSLSILILKAQDFVDLHPSLVWL